ncbi:MAG: 6-phosphofructokinase [Bacillota bacterium]
MFKGNCIVAQSGGPTAVINASACGIITEAFRRKTIEGVYAAKNGIIGVLDENLFDLRREAPETFRLLKTTPGPGLGSCRYRLKPAEKDETEYRRIFEVFEAHDIRYFFYIGGNDSMDTALKIHNYARKTGYPLAALGIPKTIDNDLPGTDHSPGYGSAAKYVAASVMEIKRDAESYNTNIVTIVEVMGRNTGWLAAAGALAAPDLIYMPETPFSFERFNEDVGKACRKKGKVLIVVSEGIKDGRGQFIFKTQAHRHDIFGHHQLGGVGFLLEDFVKEHIEPRVKTVQLGILQRCAVHFASGTDLAEAFLAGREAVRYAVDGNSGFMVSLEREKGRRYRCRTILTDLSEVANKVKPLPRDWINPAGNHVTRECLEYIRPLTEREVRLPMAGGLPRFARLKEIYLEKRCKHS